MATDNDARTQLRVDLLHAGYDPLPADGKRVLLENWSERQLTDAEVQSWAHYPNWSNTGARTRSMPTLDIDIAQADAAEAIEDLVRSRYSEHGQVLVRIGRAPRRAIPFRTAQPFDKLSVKLLAPDGTEQKLEFLGKGQQVIIDGTHPDTKQPYRWLNGRLGEVKLAELPLTSKQDATELLQDCADVLVQTYGFSYIELNKATTNGIGAFTTEPPPSDVDQTEIDVALAALHYVSPDITYEDWFHVGCSLYNILGPITGLQIWDQWSATGRKYKRGEISTKWSGIIAHDGYSYKYRFFQNLCAKAHLDSLSEAERAELRQSIENIARTHTTDESVLPPIEQSIDKPVAKEDAYYGFGGYMVGIVLPHTESDRAALLLQFLACFGCVAGRNAYYRVEDDYHHTNINVVIVAGTGSRKNTGLNRIKALLRAALKDDPAWIDQHFKPGGLSSGEGLIHAVRDPIMKYNPKTSTEEIIDQGVDDKRVMVIEAEFAALLAVMERQGNTISPILRKAWDDGFLQTMTRQSPLMASAAHISVIGHITEEELRARLKRTEMANGFANRFLFCLAGRSKNLPHGGSMPDSTTEELGNQLCGIIRWIESMPNMRITMTQAARTLWEQNYDALGKRPPGLLGAITGRAEAQCVRLALIYALLDCSKQIDVPHLKAALAVWQYCFDSARYIFGDTLGDEIADTILAALRSSEGMTRTEIARLFSSHESKGEINRGLNMLIKADLVYCKKQATSGRPTETWFPR